MQAIASLLMIVLSDAIVTVGLMFQKERHLRPLPAFLNNTIPPRPHHTARFFTLRVPCRRIRVPWIELLPLVVVNELFSPP